MGGSVAFAIRENGKISTREFHKAAVCHLTRADFFEHRGELWDAWKTEPKRPFAPDGYGLVFVDFDNKWAGAIQGYSHVGARYQRISAKEDMEDLKTCWEQGRVLGEVIEYVRLEKIKIASFEQYVQKKERELTIGGTREAWREVQFSIGPPAGWTIESFEESEPGWKEFIDAMIVREIYPAARDLVAWSEFFENRDLPSDLFAAARAKKESEQLDQNTPKARNTRKTRRI